MSNEQGLKTEIRYFMIPLIVIFLFVYYKSVWISLLFINAKDAQPHWMNVTSADVIWLDIPLSDKGYCRITYVVLIKTYFFRVQ